MLDDLPSDTRQDLLRIQLAAVRFGGGSLERLKIAVELCKQDFRDLLMSAGFGQDSNAHLAWASRPVHERDAGNWMNGGKTEGEAGG